MAWTILRPGRIHGELRSWGRRQDFPNRLVRCFGSNTKLQLVATADIGHFAAQALLNPNEYNGRAISIAGDELTFGEANEIFLSRLGKDIPRTFNFVGSTLLWAIKDVGLMFTWFEQRGYAADIDALRKEHPGLQSLGRLAEDEWIAVTMNAKGQFVINLGFSFRSLGCSILLKC
ncbi:hypothetical protein EYC84_005187 [Monilinia fructicola]|uniref:NmrA-like domain-containing protein n=1 Tax=Monilinia fructicola TaxID=38448 RepID=A0A5M9JVQ5_MONFR|nr:hypothetical protein EYC84_005187 [Monilinia fructicola]